MSDHVWAMAMTYPVSTEEAERLANGGEWELPPEGERSGPGCVTCMQPFANCKDLPCPGRIWGDEDDPKTRAFGELPRKERRRRRLKERRRFSNGSTEILVGDDGQPRPIDTATRHAMLQVKPSTPADELREGEGALVPGLEYDLTTPPKPDKPRFSAPRVPPVRRSRRIA